MSRPDAVQRLEQRFQADPTAKIFLPLAEEYRKAGKLEQAEDVLRTGLRHHPHYTAAQVALGRLLLERGERREARLVLSEAVTQSPDNLLGQRLLADAGGPLTLQPGGAQDAEPKPTPGATRRASDRLESGSLPIADTATSGEPDAMSWTLPPRWALNTEVSETTPVSETDDADAGTEQQAEAEPATGPAGDDGPDPAWATSWQPADLQAAPESVEDNTEDAWKAGAELLAREADNETGSSDGTEAAPDAEDGTEVAAEVDSREDDPPFADEREPDVPSAASTIWQASTTDEAEFEAAGTDPAHDPADASTGEDDPPFADERELDVPSAASTMWQASVADRDDDGGTMDGRAEDAAGGAAVELKAAEPDSARDCTEDDTMAREEKSVTDSPWRPEGEEQPDDPKPPDPGVWATDDSAPESEWDSDAAGLTGGDGVRDDAAAQTVRLQPSPAADDEPAGEDQPDRLSDRLERSWSMPFRDEVETRMASLAAGEPPADEEEDQSALEPTADDREVLVESLVPAPAQDFPDHDPGGEEELAQTCRTLTLARLYRRQGELDRAAAVYRQLLDLDPAHPDARRELTELCGENLDEITDEDVVPAAGGNAAAPWARAERLEDSRRRQIVFLKDWLDHIRAEG